MQIGELIDKLLGWCSRHRSPATVAFYRTRLRHFRETFEGRDLATLSPLEIDEHLAPAGEGLSDSTRHHHAVALERLQKFALTHKLLDRPVFGILEKPRVGRRERLPTSAETEAILSRASPAFRLIYSPPAAMRSPPRGTVPRDNRRCGPRRRCHHFERAQDGPQDRSGSSDSDRPEAWSAA